MLHISLFSGIGGFDLAAQRAGWKNVVSCEINPWSNKLLSFYWPEAYHHDDIHTLTYDTINAELSSRFGPGWRNEDIIISGGFPCQPYSLAGKRLGKDDTRHLWPQMLRIIREISPQWIVGENVFGIVNWDGGLVFNEVQTDLEIAGYEVQPYVLPAASINAPHKRDRCFFIAHARIGGDSRNTREISGKAKEAYRSGVEQSTTPGQQVQLPNEPNIVFGDASNARCDGFRERASERVCEKWEQSINENHNNLGDKRISEIITDPASDGLSAGYPETGGKIGCSEQGRMLESSGESDAITPDTKCFGFSQSEQQGGSRCQEGIFEGIRSKRPIADTTSQGREEWICVRGRKNTQKDGARLESWTERLVQDGDASDPDCFRLEQRTDGEKMGGGQSEMGREGGESSDAVEADGEIRDASDPDRQRLEGSASKRVQDYERRRNGIYNAKPTWMGKRSGWENFPTQSPICSRNDGIPGGLDGITFSKWRTESIKGYGNAVVVPLVEVIFKAINQYREKYPS